jgi:two-component system cell cycle response regulator
VRGLPSSYLLLLSARNDRDDVARWLAAGADDYIIKPFYGRELLERVRSGIRMHDLQRRLRAAEEHLREQATRDVLTGLWNRRAILDLLEGEMARAKRGGASLAVAIVDVDHFKRINDAYGHACGDDVLRQVSRAMAGALWCGDHVGRYGGEEFLALLPGCASDEAAAVTERLRATVEALSITLPSGETVRVSVTAGVATLAAGQEMDSADLIASADEALFVGKRAGRNRVVAAALGPPCSRGRMSLRRAPPACRSSGQLAGHTQGRRLLALPSARPSVSEIMRWKVA